MTFAGRIANADSVVAPAAGVDFETKRMFDGKSFVLIGAGMRKKPPIIEYAMALYVDEAGARRAFPALAGKAGGRSKEKLLNGDRSQLFVIWGDFGKIAIIRFARDTEAEKIREGLVESLEPLLSDKAPVDLKNHARVFISAFDRDMKQGEEIVVETQPSGSICTTVTGSRREGPTDPRLVRALWEIWLGQKPLSKELSRALIERIDVLGR